MSGSNDPRHGSVTVTISGTSARLLAHLAEAESRDAGDLLMQALSVLDLALKAKRDGKRLAFLDPATGATSEVVL